MKDDAYLGLTMGLTKLLGIAWTMHYNTFIHYKNKDAFTRKVITLSTLFYLSCFISNISYKNIN